MVDRSGRNNWEEAISVSFGDGVIVSNNIVVNNVGEGIDLKDALKIVRYMYDVSYLIGKEFLMVPLRFLSRIYIDGMLIMNIILKFYICCMILIRFACLVLKRCLLKY